MSLKGVKNIFFDLGGVLVDLEKARCIKEFSDQGISNAETRIERSHKTGLFLALETGSISVTEFHDQFRKIAGCFISDENIDRTWNLYLGEVHPKKIDLLKKFRSQYHVYMLSNTSKIHFDFLKDHTFLKEKGCAIEDCFDKCYLSYELHLYKPDPKIYEYVLNDTSSKASECLFIDDDELNIEAAKNLGFKTCLYKSMDDLKELFGEF
ncbi:MAG TPA: HAD family phosphatase [Paludibacteraceae bacterium]|nr:HAD family phosphatase [Paludibacteraceae bacterium]HQF50340.1 HAD family phosphatase [Paludibacteraceae bacterium]